MIEWLQLPRASVSHVRKSMTPGDDFANVPRQGITFTPTGLQKIKGALPAPWAEAEARTTPPEKNSAPPEPPPDSVTLRVRQRSGNGRTVLCAADAFPDARLWVEPTGRQKATTLMPGMELPGCVLKFPDNATIFLYHGPLPLRLGLPMPEQPKQQGEATA